MIRILSAYRIILWSSFLTLIPVISDEFLMSSARSSMERANMSGDKGHPRLVPLVMENVLEKKPDVNTEAEGEVYNELITTKIGPEKTNLSKIFCIYYQWTRSKAFSVSNESNTESAKMSW